MGTVSTSTLLLVASIAACSAEPGGIVVSPTVRPQQICGANLSYHRDGRLGGYGSPTSEEAIDRLAALGMRNIAVTPFGYIDSLSSTEVNESPDLPFDSLSKAVLTEAKWAKGKGLDLAIKLHLWIGDGEFSGKLDPAPSRGGWAAWFIAYEAYVLRWAKVAQQASAAALIIGIELGSATVAHEARWRAMITKVRAVYDGKVTYGANWDEAERITFWDALDAIGVQLFAPLTDQRAPSQSTLDRGAAGWLGRFEALSRRESKPLWLTEVGFANREDTAIRPSAWPERLRPKPQRTAQGDAEQARAYRAIIHTFGNSPLVDVMCWWRWHTDPVLAQKDRVTFFPRGRPAEAVLATACGGNVP